MDSTFILNQGVFAFNDGLGIEANPYPIGSPESRKWSEGWNVAHDEETDQNAVIPAPDLF